MTGDERVVLSVAIGEYERTVKDSVKQHGDEVRRNAHDREAQENLADAKRDLQTVENLKSIFGM